MTISSAGKSFSHICDVVSCIVFCLVVSISFRFQFRFRVIRFFPEEKKTYHRKTELSDLFSIILYMTAIIPSHGLATPGECSQTWFVWHLGLNKYSRATISLRYNHLPMLNKTNMAPPFLNNISTYLDCKFTWIFSWWQTTWNCLHYLCLWGWLRNKGGSTIISEGVTSMLIRLNHKP